MASHCHHHHHHCFATPAAASSCSCCCGCPCSPPQPPPATAAADPLILQAIAAQLLQSPPPPIFSNQYLQSLHYLYQNPSPPPASEPQPHHWHEKQTSQHPHREKHQQHQGHNDLVESLVQRISTLESSLPHAKSCCAPGPDAPQTAVRRPHLADRTGKDPLPRPAPPRRLASSLRDAAARVIQSQFRLYLIGRSQTLRDLKHLAAIRSNVATLKSSLRFDGREPHLLDLKTVRSRAVDLLEKLDRIQSSDPMIREGKRSIRMELIGITELTDGVVKRLIANSFEEQQAHSQRFSKPATRRVTFGDSSNEGESRASEDDLDAEGEEEDEGNDDHESHANNETQHRLKNLGKSGGKPGLYAPLPVKMESRRIDSGDNANGN